MTADLVFEEPPHAGRGPGGGILSPIGEWLNELRKHPGQWAKYPDRVHPSVVTDINKGRRYGVTAGEFDAVGRDNKNDPKLRSILFTRYVGSES